MIDNAAQHVHEWTEHQPGTWGSGIVRACSCGLYDIARPSSPGLTIEQKGQAARAMRVWSEQGYILTDTDPGPPDNGGGERG